jgi:hypothetical protein
MELTEREKNIILDLRKKEQEKINKQLKAVSLIRTAMHYLEFMQDQGFGNTYSTFCDDFGYEVTTEGEVRNFTWLSVTKIINLALGKVQ